uniref:Uncharacterized protein n=1 Tax=Physcomitrium patens TaxID=3218 RepID=A0A2K1JQ80_PHYPA|nr:hypothetical protein PHYPA_016063 [Physcomitrium patens]
MKLDGTWNITSSPVCSIFQWIFSYSLIFYIECLRSGSMLQWINLCRQYSTGGEVPGYSRDGITSDSLLRASNLCKVCG